MTSLCDKCGNWPAFCKCIPQEARLPRAELLAQECKRWTDEASVQGGLKLQAEQAQLRALDLAHRAQTQLMDLLNDSRSKS